MFPDECHVAHCGKAFFVDTERTVKVQKTQTQEDDAEQAVDDGVDQAADAASKGLDQLADGES